jgi:hypothetical protein
MDEMKFKDIWETLYNVDVSKHTEEKMNLTYLSWARAWMLLMEHYPQAEYTFVDYDGLPYRTLPDGTAEVITKVQIEGHTRSMALPIMDYKNNAVVNPNARQVNDNRMRCLVKNLAMFGLGMSVFAVWEDHLPDEEKDKQPVAKKQPKKEEPKEVSKPEPKEDDTKTEEWADAFIEATEKTMGLNESKEELRSFMKANAKGFSDLKIFFPEHRDKLNDAISKYADTLPEKTISQTEE